MNDKIAFSEFVEQVALESGYDVDTARQYVEDMFETIVEESAKGRYVKVRNFGSFQPRRYEAKRGINPQTGQPIEILPHYHIHFAVSKDLEKTINRGKTSTPISLNEPSNGILGKLVTVLLVALLGAWIYRAFFMPDIDVHKVIKTPKQVVVAPIVEESITYEEPAPIESKVIPKEPEPVIERLLFPGTYTVKKNETLSHIGLKIYKNSSFWPLIYQANRDKLNDPDKIQAGMRLTIPDLSKGKALQKAYIAVHDNYIKVDKMSKSFWILCEGAKFMGSDFQEVLARKLHPYEYKIIKKCSLKVE